MDNTKAMPRLVLKRGKFSRSSGQWPDEDYDVLADGKVVGRIYEDASASTPPELRWFWSVTEIVPATPGVTNGHAATLEEAMAKFRAAWGKARAPFEAIEFRDGDVFTDLADGVRPETPPSDDYIRFDEIEDVLASVDLVALLAPLVRDQPQHWKWVIIGAHSALQDAMVCALRDSSSTSILTKKSAAETLDWLGADEATRGKYPKERLADFEDLMRRCVRGAPNCEPLVLTHQQCRDIRRLHRAFRNNFAHFVPKGWSIEKVGLPRIIGAALDVLRELMNRSQVAYHMEEDQRTRLNSALHTAELALRWRE
jgi:hypothetical protein